MFSFHDFIKNGFLKAVGSRPDYWIILNAAGYLDKGVLTEDDLAEIQAAIGRKNTPAVVIPETEEEADHDDAETDT